MWVYIQSEPGLYTVGHYGPGGKWHAESDYATREEAAGRCHFLNGGRADEPADAGSYQDYRHRTGR